MVLRNIPLKWSRKHRTRLQKAAGVAKVDLLCTALTWQLLRDQAKSPFSSIEFPGLAKEGTPDREMLRISLTGPQAGAVHGTNPLAVTSRSLGPSPILSVPGAIRIMSAGDAPGSAAGAAGASGASAKGSRRRTRRALRRRARGAGAGWCPRSRSRPAPASGCCRRCRRAPRRRRPCRSPRWRRWARARAPGAGAPRPGRASRRRRSAELVAVEERRLRHGIGRGPAARRRANLGGGPRRCARRGTGRRPALAGPCGPAARRPAGSPRRGRAMGGEAGERRDRAPGGPGRRSRRWREPRSPPAGPGR